ncbi:MAG: hypothetical protein ABIU06_14235 [Anaerolineales bacterium]
MAPEQQSGTKDVVFLSGGGNYKLAIVGEARNQDALETLCGPRVPTGVNRFETAWLILEDKNPQDKNAVRVEFRRKPVGYLSRETAILFRQQLKAKGKPNADGQCPAVIKGGWLSSDGRKGTYDVWLDFPTLHQ